MMLAKLLICSILIFLTRGTFITLQKCTTRTQCTDNGKAPNTTQQTISLERNTLIPGKAGPKGLKGDQGERGRDCNEAKFNTEITQIKSIVKYNIAALDRVTAKNEADITLFQNNIEALQRVTANNEADITNSQNNIEDLEKVTAKNEADITNSQNEIESFKTVTAKNEAELHDQVEDLKTELNATKINLNQSNEQLQTLRDDLNETKNELSSANGPKGLKGDQGERGEQGVRGKTGKRGRDCNIAKITTKITQIESIVKYEIESFKIVMVKNEAELHDQFEYLKTQLNATKINLNQSNEQLQTLRDDLNETKNELSSAQDQVEDLKTQLNATKINLNQSNEQLQTLRDDLNETKNELSSANDKITRLEVKMQMLISATTTPVSPTTVTTAPKTILSDEDRARTCGLISNVEDSALTASTTYHNAPSCGPQNARLFSTSGDGSWFPEHYYGQWIQIDLGAVKQVRGVATQGSYKVYGWITKYSISFKREPSSNLQNVVNEFGSRKIFPGNTDRNTVIVNDVDITARYIRINPHKYGGSPRLRFDILTC